MKVFYCEICDISKYHKSKNKHNKTKRHYFMEIYVSNIYIYKNIVWDDVEKIVHENIVSHNIKFNEFKIYVTCKINDDLEIKVCKNQLDLCKVMVLFIDLATLYVPVAGTMICNNIRENLSSKYAINCTSNKKK